MPRRSRPRAHLVSSPPTRRAAATGPPGRQSRGHDGGDEGQDLPLAPRSSPQAMHGGIAGAMRKAGSEAERLRAARAHCRQERLRACQPLHPYPRTSSVATTSRDLRDAAPPPGAPSGAPGAGQPGQRREESELRRALHHADRQEFTARPTAAMTGRHRDQADHHDRSTNVSMSVAEHPSGISPLAMPAVRTAFGRPAATRRTSSPSVPRP